MPQHVRMLELVFRDVSRFDIVHFHCDYIHFPLIRRLGCESVTTLHGQLYLHDLGPLLEEYRDIPLVSISNSQRRAVSRRKLAGNGVPRSAAHSSHL